MVEKPQIVQLHDGFEASQRLADNLNRMPHMKGKDSHVA